VQTYEIGRTLVVEADVSPSTQSGKAVAVVAIAPNFVVQSSPLGLQGDVATFDTDPNG
jgi:hypothetical protein